MPGRLPALAAAAGERAGLEGVRGSGQAAGPLPAYFFSLLSSSGGAGSRGTPRARLPSPVPAGFLLKHVYNTGFPGRCPAGLVRKQRRESLMSFAAFPQGEDARGSVVDVNVSATTRR